MYQVGLYTPSLFKGEIISSAKILPGHMSTEDTDDTDNDSGEEVQEEYVEAGRRAKHCQILRLLRLTSNTLRLLTKNKLQGNYVLCLLHIVTELICSIMYLHHIHAEVNIDLHNLLSMSALYLCTYTS